MNYDPKEIEQALMRSPEAALRLSQIARELVLLIKEADPYIQKHTEAVCPACTSVCCINRHSRGDHEDFIYYFSLGLRPVSDISGIPDNGPCRFLGKEGCGLKRHLRPYRCTWYFCSPLLEHMQCLSAREYRRMSGMLCSMTEKRQLLSDEFSKIFGADPVLRS